ncbi:glycosyltransferase [Candidatus Omnitrophota bacterium]
MSEKRPKVSVVTRTYNQEKFIAQAIESVLMQQVDFDYEFVIGEDCSSDATREVVLRYQKKYPEIIRPFLPEHNVGRHKNFGTILEMTRGHYTALLDGDDYWVDPHKLQRQVEYLDSHPECSLCFHNAILVYESETKNHLFNTEQLQPILTLEDLLHRNFIPSCSPVFRTKVYGILPQWFYSIPVCDWPLFILCAQKGSLKYFEEPMGVYRIHHGGIWAQSYEEVSTGRIQQRQADIEVYKIFSKHLGSAYEKLIKKEIKGRVLQKHKEQIKHMLASAFPTVYRAYRRMRH